jgi:hypothetical protein
MVEITRAAIALKEFLDVNQISRRDAAKAMGISVAVLFYWTTGRLRPKPPQAQKIARYTGGKVPMELWFTESETEEIRNTKPFRPSKTSKPQATSSN